MWQIFLITLIGAAVISGLGLLSVRADRMKRKHEVSIKLAGGHISAERDSDGPSRGSKPSGIMSMVGGSGQITNEEENLASVGNRPR